MQSLRESLQIRLATEADIDAMRALFRDTITTINPKDYTASQIEVWAAGAELIERWQRRVQTQRCFLAFLGAQLVGMGSLARDGYLDLMYTHKDFQGRGIAGKLLEMIEKQVLDWGLSEIYVDVSITARPFFLRHGYRIERIEDKDVRGMIFENAAMRKGIK